jgi:isoleucyl-tRNA synthetase
MGKWIISLTEQLNETVQKSLEEYNTVKACASIKEYINDLSTWYIRNSRDRFNNNDETAKKTLRYALEKLTKIAAPIIPFATEKIYQDINNKASVHLQSYPKSNQKLIDKKLEQQMETAREIVSIALRERDKAHISLKWPLAKIEITINKKISKITEEIKEIIKKQINVKNIIIHYKITIKDQITIKEKLDTKITTELEAEGFAREISRKIQATRKKAGLIKSDSIELEISSNFNEKLKSQLDFIKERVGAKTISLNKSNKKYSHSEEGKIKDKSFLIRFNKL